MLGKGRKDESGDVTAGAGLAANQVDVLLEFITSRSVTRADTAQKLANAVGMTRSGDAGVAEMVEIDSILNALGVGEDAAMFDPSTTKRQSPSDSGSTSVIQPSIQAKSTGSTSARRGISRPAAFWHQYA